MLGDVIGRSRRPGVRVSHCIDNIPPRGRRYIIYGHCRSLEKGDSRAHPPLSVHLLGDPFSEI